MVQRHKQKKEESSITRLPDALNPSLLSVQVLLLPWFSSSFLLAFFFSYFDPKQALAFLSSFPCARAIVSSLLGWFPPVRFHPTTELLCTGCCMIFPTDDCSYILDKIKSNYFYLMSFMKANRKQMDLTKCWVLVQQACKTWAQCYCVIQVSSQTCFGWLLSWREPAA